jgi:hypothetical protein
MLGEATGLTLGGTPPSSVRSSFRVLDELGLLTDSMVWSMLSITAVDPFFFIRTLRTHKAAVGFHPEEHHVGEDVVFLAGDKNSLGYRVAYHVDVFTNDISVLVRSSDRYLNLHTYAGVDITEEVVKATGGEAELLRKVKQHVDSALAYKA